MRYRPCDGNSLAKVIDPPQRRSDGILATRRPTGRRFCCHGSKHKGQEPPSEEQHGQGGVWGAQTSTRRLSSVYTNCSEHEPPASE